MKLITSVLLAVTVNAVSEKNILHSNLFENYTKTLLPFPDDEAIVKINVSLILLKIIELDIHKGLLASKIVLGLSWRDNNLMWNDKLNNISYINVDIEDIWYPHAYICNDMSGNFAVHKGGATIEYDGTVTFHMDGIFQTYCTIDMHKYPFDEHECYIKTCLRHQKYKEQTMQNFSFHNRHDSSSDSWDFKFVVGDVMENGIVSARVIIYANRKSMSETFTHFIFPALLTILNLGVYVLPAETGEKVSVAITIFLANVVYLTESAKSLGSKSRGVSRYLLYLLILTLISGFSTFVSIIVCKFYVNETAVHETSIPEKTSGSKNKVGIMDESVQDNVIIENTSRSKKRSYTYRKLDWVSFFVTLIFLLSYIVFAVV
ncbi:acetylcholine receptor subunit alpha-like 2 [Octopus sinensis]|uniref:Acetylcholine receptor subunit alpha-like 2 n=1 Tax=Octopus sinensis TaxID=2607531 RepID=A0A7E6FDZ9_9MOLL|nr:acetylcholine receptor subunit alpha-like 2 [Octopus sinensis]